MLDSMQRRLGRFLHARYYAAPFGSYIEHFWWKLWVRFG